MVMSNGATPGAILSATPGATPRQRPVNGGATHTPYTPSVAPALGGWMHAANGGRHLVPMPPFRGGQEIVVLTSAFALCGSEQVRHQPIVPSEHHAAVDHAEHGKGGKEAAFDDFTKKRVHEISSPNSVDYGSTEGPRAPELTYPSASTMKLKWFDKFSGPARGHPLFDRRGITNGLQFD